jgi:hypothetical protein
MGSKGARRKKNARGFSCVTTTIVVRARDTLLNSRTRNIHHRTKNEKKEMLTLLPGWHHHHFRKDESNNKKRTKLVTMYTYCLLCLGYLLSAASRWPHFFNRILFPKGASTFVPCVGG